MNREVFEELSLDEIKFNSLNNARLLRNLIRINLNPANNIFNPSNHSYICKKIEIYSELSLEEVKILIEDRSYYYKNFIERLKINIDVGVHKSLAQNCLVKHRRIKSS